MVDPVVISAASCVTATGIGMANIYASLVDGKTGLAKNDFTNDPLDCFIGRVANVEDVILSPAQSHFLCRNNQLAKLSLQADGFDDQVADAVSKFGASRVAVVVGTTTAGITVAENAFSYMNENGLSQLEGYDFSGTQSHASLAEFVKEYLNLEGLAYVISTACSSSAKVFADAKQLLDAGLADAVVIGGVDSLCMLTLYGFNSLELVAPEICRPCDANRKGLSIGEAGGFALLMRATDQTPGDVCLYGYGESSDAYHISAPHPDGQGARGAMQSALTMAGLVPGDLSYVNMHGTGSQKNDAAEDLAISTVFGNDLPVSSTKGWTGHTLGAAGIVEAVISMLSIKNNFMPRTLNMQNRDRTLSCNILDQSKHENVQYVLSNSFGFGGNNCCLILGKRSK